MNTITLFRTPDALENPIAAATEPKKAIAKQLNADIDFGAVLTKVNQAWSEDNAVSLKWMTQPDFSANVLAFNQKLTNRNIVGSNRPSLTQGIKAMDEKIDAGVTEVKIYIAKKYKKAGAIAQYPRFGINKIRHSYRIPGNQESRMASLGLMVDSIVADGMTDEEYGGAFWADMLVNYTKTVGNASGTDQEVSGTVSSKNVLRGNLKKVLSSLRFVLRGNYPDTYASVYRTWGWMKEKY